MKDNTLLFIATIITALLLGLIAYQDSIIEKSKDIINHIDTTVIKDTVYKPIIYRDTVPKYISKTVVKKDTLYKDSTQYILALQHKTYGDTITNNGDTTKYEAYITGYGINNDSMPKLDSLKLSTSHKTIYVDRTITKTIKVSQKQNKWGVTIGVGTGYGIINKQADIYVGFTVGYKIW